MKPILKLDYGDWISGSETERRTFVEQIMESLESTGYVKLVNHGFSEQQLTDVFKWSRVFFDQDLEVKKEVLNDTNPTRGYTTYGAETTAYLGMGEESHDTKDSKEAFDQGNKNDLEYPNKWPNGLPGFQDFMEAFYEQCDAFCMSLIKALEDGLGIQDESITKRCIPSDTDFRLTHYPPISLAEITSGRRIRIASHIDFGVISLLFQDTVGGLEVEDRTKPGLEHFIPIKPDNTSEMLVNLGSTMQRWTNDRLFGGLHRVAIPHGMKPLKGSGTEDDTIIPGRISVAFLFKARKDVSMGPVAAFVNEETPARYPEISGLEYHQRLNDKFY